MNNQMSCTPLKPAEAIPISGPFSWASDGVTVFYFADPEPFDSHPAEDTRALRMRIAKFCCTSGVRIVDLERAFEMSLSTVKRAVKLYAAEGEEGFRKPLRRPGAGPRRRAVTPEAARRAGKMLSGGMSRRACALELGIHPAAFNDNLRAGVIREPAVSAPRSPGRTERDRRDKRTGTVRACRDVERRRPAAAGLLVEASPPPPPALTKRLRQSPGAARLQPCRRCLRKVFLIPRTACSVCLTASTDSLPFCC